MAALTTLRAVPPFRYMDWAKRHILAPPKYHLGLSGLAPPAGRLVTLPTDSLDLEHRGRHMPPVLAERMAARLAVDRGELMLTLGTSHAMYLLCAATLRPDDLCLVERPAYEMLATLPTLFGARVERFDRSFDERWRPSAQLPDRIRRTRPRLVLLSNPHNPTGTLLSRAELEPIIGAAADVGAVVGVDEVYLEFLDQPPEHSARSLGRHVAVASSFTKAYGLGTVRFGWLCADPAMVTAALAYNDYISVLYPNPSATVAMAALDVEGALKERANAIVVEQRQLVQRWIDGRDDVTWHAPDAGVVGFVRLPMEDAGSFCEGLLTQHDTLIVPGHFFEAAGFARLGFGGDAKLLASGLEQIATALNTMKS